MNLHSIVIASALAVAMVSAADTPTPTTTKPTPAPTTSTPITSKPTPAVTVPTPAVTPAATKNGKWFDVSVEGDATYNIQGPICSGSGDKPAGTNCPVIGDVAVKDCLSKLKSYNKGASKCVAPVNATCQKIKTGAWGCVWDLNSTGKPTPAPTTSSDGGKPTSVTPTQGPTPAPTGKSTPAPTGKSTSVPASTTPSTTIGKPPVDQRTPIPTQVKLSDQNQTTPAPTTNSSSYQGQQTPTATPVSSTTPSPTVQQSNSKSFAVANTDTNDDGHAVAFAVGGAGIAAVVAIAAVAYIRKQRQKQIEESHLDDHTWVDVVTP